jgi:predicted transcriptional regulator
MELKQWDPFVSTDEEVEVDGETEAAIREGIEDADAERVVTLEQAREQMEQWLLKSSFQQSIN